MRSTNSLRRLALVFSMFSVLGLAACDAAEGPAENVGEKVDEGVKDTKRGVKDAVD